MQHWQLERLHAALDAATQHGKQRRALEGVVSLLQKQLQVSQEDVIHLRHQLRRRGQLQHRLQRPHDRPDEHLRLRSLRDVQHAREDERGEVGDLAELRVDTPGTEPAQAAGSSDPPSGAPRRAGAASPAAASSAPGRA